MIVYLDSSIITNFASKKSDTIEIVRSIPGVKFASSICHIVEALPKTEASVEQSIFRLRIITDRKYSVAVLPFTDLIERELSENNVDLKQGVFCDWHELFKLEDEVFSLANLKEKAKKSFNEALESIPDLNLRRQQKAKLILRGKFRGNHIGELIRQNQETVLREALAKLPEIAPIFGPGGMYDAIFGRVKPDAFRNLAKETLLHPAVLAKLSFHPEFDLKPVSNFFWDQADKLVDLINKQIVQASELQSKTGMHFDYLS